MLAHVFPEDSVINPLICNTDIDWIPRDPVEAATDPEWLQSTLKEVGGLTAKGSWEVVDRPTDGTPV
jgi:hypothetical protein